MDHGRGLTWHSRDEIRPHFETCSLEPLTYLLPRESFWRQPREPPNASSAIAYDVSHRSFVVSLLTTYAPFLPPSGMWCLKFPYYDRAGFIQEKRSRYLIPLQLRGRKRIA